MNFYKQNPLLLDDLIRTIDGPKTISDGNLKLLHIAQIHVVGIRSMKSQEGSTQKGRLAGFGRLPKRKRKCREHG